MPSRDPTRADAVLDALRHGRLVHAAALLARGWEAASSAEDRVQLALAGAELARRRGTPREARVWLRDARAALALAEAPVADGLRADLAWTEAVEAIEAGAHARAERLLDAALEPARAASAAHAVRFHLALGAIAARQARATVAASHYRLALDHADADTAAQIRSNLAMVLLQRGALDEARAQIAAALAHRARPDAPPGPCANSLAVRAMIDEASGERPDWTAALAQAEASGDAVLTAEIALHYAMRLRRDGDGAAAAHQIRRVAADLPDIGQREPSLRALLLEARGWEAYAAAGPEPARVALAEAASAWAALGARWHELRVQFALARMEHEAGQMATACARADRACRRATTLGLDLPVDAGTQATILAAAGAGEPACAAWARQRGWRAEAPWPGGVQLDLPAGRLTIDGATQFLGRRSRVLRLLDLLAAAGAHGVTIRELSRRLWRGDAPGPAVTARLRVLVGRARALTEPDHVLVLTVRGEGRYRWNPEVPVTRSA
jgi:hypothetical protein